LRLKVRAEEADGNTLRLVFSAEDSGIGIRREDMDRLFDKFERLDMQRNSTVEGSGLGLVITRSLLDMMDGTIEVESEYGKGSVFTVTIPQQIVSEDEDGDTENRTVSEAAERQEAFRAPDARVLIVDDTKMNLTVTAGLLKYTEMQIDTALSGAEAVAMAEKTAYDVIFMDSRMPGMDGAETLRRIRGLDGPNRGTPVICLTADAIVGAKERYLAEGFSDYLSKPVNSRMLEDMLVKYLPKEKVMATVGPEPEKPDAPEGDRYDPLRKAGIAPENGLNYCQGDRELYDTLLSEYLGEYRERSGLLGSYFEARDWKNYVIFAHSLKSSSKMLGADDLSGMAARMEAAANSGDEDAILKEHGMMMERYDEVIRAVRQVATAPETGDEPEILEFAPE
jgi:CheY-like chemotaxis protein